MKINKQKYILQELDEENKILKSNLQKKQDVIDRCEYKNNALEIEVSELRQELESIKYSKGYKIIQKIKKFAFWR